MMISTNNRSFNREKIPSRAVVNERSRLKTSQKLLPEPFCATQQNKAAISIAGQVNDNNMIVDDPFLGGVIGIVNNRDEVIEGFDQFGFRLGRIKVGRRRRRGLRLISAGLPPSSQWRSPCSAQSIIEGTAPSSTATIRGEIVIASATRLIRGRTCVILGGVRHREVPLEETWTLHIMAQGRRRCRIHLTPVG